MTSKKNLRPNSGIESLNAEENKENVQVKQLKDKVEQLEKQLAQHENEIKELKRIVMSLSNNNSHVNGSETVISTNGKGPAANQTDAVVRQDQVCPTASNAESSQNPARPTSVKEKEAERPVILATNKFIRWMNSQDSEHSLWSDDTYCRSLLSYIGKRYGQYRNIRHTLEHLRIGRNGLEELDQLYRIIKEFEKQPGAEESLHKWRTEDRSGRRFEEIKAIFEHHNTSLLLNGDLKVLSLSPPNLEKIIPCESIKGYFDMICRDGSITVDIGTHLKLGKENIFGGGDYVVHNEYMTFIDVDLNQSKIDLDNNRVDLITCLMTLHHVPDLDFMLCELVRILRPGGYLILREHDVKKERTMQAKYLNFIHAFMMIAHVGEFANDSEGSVTNWEREKVKILNYTNEIQYKTQDEWKRALENVGFRRRAIINCNDNYNPQAWFYAVYQLDAK